MKLTLSVLTVAVLAALVAMPAAAEDSARPTFYKDVLPILQENCQVCHRALGKNMGGMVAPMSFMSYGEVRPWAKSIAKVVSDKTMPPWHATEEFDGLFRDERTLTDEEIATLAKWSKTGAARGRELDAPPAIEFPDSEWSIGEPDIIVKMPEPYWIADEVEDIYVDIPVKITDEQLPEARWIQAAEIKAGSGAVHHVIARPLGGMAPGIGAKQYPEGYGAMLKPGTTVNFDMHYHKEAGPGTGEWDQTEIAVKFHTKPVHHELRSTPIGNRWFELPPNHSNWEVGASMTFDKDTILMSMTPHMHLRGKSAKYVAFYPDGTTEVLLDVPAYDFNWQTPFEYKETKILPAGTRVDVTMFFDNSTENDYVPNPNRAVRFGGPTTDEMMLGWISITEAEPKPDPLVSPATD